MRDLPVMMKRVVTYISYLGKYFSFKNHETLSYFLSVQATSAGLFLCQQKYVHNIILRAQMQGVKPIRKFISMGKNLHPGDIAILFYAKEYQRLVGALQYLALTRPELVYATNKLS